MEQVRPLQQDNIVSHAKLRAAFTLLAQPKDNQANRKVVIFSQVPISVMRVHNFIWIKLPEFYGSKIDEDPIEFIEEAYWVVEVIDILSEEKSKLVAYQLKGVPKIWFE